MKERRWIKITTTRRRILRVQPINARVHWPVCNCLVETRNFPEPIDALQIKEHVLSHLINGDQVHTITTVSGSFRVCRDSLFIRQEP